MIDTTAHDEFIDQIPGYALGSLDAEEAARLAAHLETCPACRVELAAYAAVADSLALAAPIMTPPEQLKARLLARATAQQEKAPVRQDSWWARQKLRWAGPGNRSRLAPALALAVLLLAVAALIIWQRNQAREAARFTLAPTELAPGAEGVITVTQGGAATLAISKLPALTAEQQYQLWLIQDGQRESGAVFSVAADGSAQVPIEAEQPLSSYSAFGITIEPAGGSPGPTGERVLGYNL